mmetsp:Transcript_30541/g.88680  ORF Transcript_30541/g.88680 Transcript_30541/m.88680 type:complete len:170 (-) Transcript_30541:36-545(-)
MPSRLALLTQSRSPGRSFPNSWKLPTLQLLVLPDELPLELDSLTKPIRLCMLARATSPALEREARDAEDGGSAAETERWKIRITFRRCATAAAAAVSAAAASASHVRASPLSNSIMAITARLGEGGPVQGTSRERAASRQGPPTPNRQCRQLQGRRLAEALLQREAQGD